MTTFPPLPPIGPGLLLRALFKGASDASAPTEQVTHYTLPCIDAIAVRRYADLMGFSVNDLPITYYYLLAQRAHMATMLGPQFPFRLAGMIHVENAICELLRPELALPMELVTRVVVDPPAERGARYCELLTVGSQREQSVFECRSRYLAVRGERRAGRERSGEPAEAAGELKGEWSLSAQAGRQYASVSGDWNPIHLWPWSARLLGMKAPIIHGMHSVAKACALLEQAEGRRLSQVSAGFKSPILLGSHVELRVAAPGEYQVWSGGKLAVEGGWH